MELAGAAISAAKISTAASASRLRFKNVPAGAATCGSRSTNGGNCSHCPAASAPLQATPKANAIKTARHSRRSKVEPRQTSNPAKVQRQQRSSPSHGAGVQASEIQDQARNAANKAAGQAARRGARPSKRNGAASEINAQRGVSAASATPGQVKAVSAKAKAARVKVMPHWRRPSRLE